MARHKRRPAPYEPVTHADLAHGPPPIPGVPAEHEAEVALLAKDVIRYTREEAREQKEWAWNAYLNGSTPQKIATMCRARWPRFTVKRAKQLVKQVREDLAEARSDVDVEARRAEHIDQIKRWALHAQGERDRAGKWVRHPNHQALARYKRLEMDLDGTIHLPKIEVHQTFNRALVQVIGEMSPEEADRLLAEAREQERLADRAKNLLPAIVDVPASDGE
jgi:hypothetical protein